MPGIPAHLGAVGQGSDRPPRGRAQCHPPLFTDPQAPEPQTLGFQRAQEEKRALMTSQHTPKSQDGPGSTTSGSAAAPLPKGSIVATRLQTPGSQAWLQGTPSGMPALSQAQRAGATLRLSQGRGRLDSEDEGRSSPSLQARGIGGDQGTQARCRWGCTCPTSWSSQGQTSQSHHQGNRGPSSDPDRMLAGTARWGQWLAGDKSGGWGQELWGPGRARQHPRYRWPRTKGRSWQGQSPLQ